MIAGSLLQAIKKKAGLLLAALHACSFDQKIALASAILSGVSAFFAAMAAVDAARAAKVQSEIQRPHVNLLEDYLDIRQEDERVLILFKNFGQVPARDTRVDVVVFDGNNFKYVDSFVDPNVLPPGKHKESSSMPIPEGAANVVFCISYMDVNENKYKEAEAFTVRRAHSETGLIPLSGLLDYAEARRLRNGCQYE